MQEVTSLLAACPVQVQCHAAALRCPSSATLSLPCKLGDKCNNKKTVLHHIQQPLTCTISVSAQLHLWSTSRAYSAAARPQSMSQPALNRRKPCRELLAPLLPLSFFAALPAAPPPEPPLGVLPAAPGPLAGLAAGPTPTAAPVPLCRTDDRPPALPLLLLLVTLSESVACSAATLRIVYSADMSGTGFMVVKLLRPSFLPVNDLLLSMGAPDTPLLLPSQPVGVLKPGADAAEGVHGPARTLLLLLCQRLAGSPTALLILQVQAQGHPGSVYKCVQVYAQNMTATCTVTALWRNAQFCISMATASVSCHCCHVVTHLRPLLLLLDLLRYRPPTGPHDMSSPTPAAAAAAAASLVLPAILQFTEDGANARGARAQHSVPCSSCGGSASRTQGGPCSSGRCAGHTPHHFVICMTQ
jgi:hypothetical protein